MSVQSEFHDHLAEWQYRTRTSAVWAGGHALRALTGTSVSELATKGGSLDTYMLGTVGIGLSIAVRVFIANQEHDQQIRRLTSFYRQEIGEYLGIPAADVGEDELKIAAERIPSLDDALERNDKRRAVKMAAWIGGSLLAGAVLLTVGIPLISGLVVQTLAPALLAAIPALAGHTLVVPVMTSVVAAVAGTALFQATTELVESIGKSLTDTRDPTAHDLTRAIARQVAAEDARPVTQAQVFDVFLAANPGMNQQIQQMLGKPFEKLDRVTQTTILQQYEPVLHMQDIANDLNGKQIRAQELMFKVSGKASGIVRLPEPPRTQAERLEMQLQQSMAHGKEKAGHWIEDGKVRAQALREQASQRIHHARETVREGGWKALLDRKPADQSAQTWAERSQSSPSAASDISR